jgi:uncharacterized protein
MKSLVRRAAWARVLPFAVFVAWLALHDRAQAWPLPGGWDARWLYGAQLALAAALLLALRRDYGELAVQLRPQGRHAWAAVAAGLAVFAAWVTLDAPWMLFGRADAVFDPTDAQGRIDPTMAALRVVGTVFVAPVVEGLFWRSFLMRWIDDATFDRVAPNAITGKAVVLSTFLFVLMHPQWLAAALAGLAYAWLYIASGRLWTAILAHAVTNAALAAWALATRQWQLW